MRQLLVECSDPGLVVTLAEEFEHVLRHVDFARAQELKSKLGELARELGPEFEELWQNFRVETPNEVGYRPLNFGSREAVDEERLRELLAQAKERAIGQFELSRTLLLPQDGPAPETREQYVHDLADGIRGAPWDELGVFQMPVNLPDQMAAHRLKLMEEYAGEVLRARARFPTVGHRWVRDSAERLEKALEEVSTRAEAVMTYELARLSPKDVEPEERLRWAALAARLGEEVEKWYAAAEEQMSYIYQRAALAYLLWTECSGFGPARSFLEKRLQALIAEAEAVYTADGVAALREVYDELRRPPWARLGSTRAKDERTDTSG
ncbi:MAG: hypothetical protein NUW06_06940 [Candidatus Acetothermia bacterium]|jgi:hypothetical protein|nr:hypothetical protein [Candidatus Acetothermia bacterium]MDH7505859.1 hypothetical protein [Candidatus Acetothermia bacterium]